MEYEKAYIAFIEQVKDKSHEEQVKFLVSHMNELRGMLDLFSFCRDEELFPKSSLVTEPTVNDEVLANVMIYRYENKISILDDEYCEKTEDYAREIRSSIYKRRSKEKRKALDKLKKEHPEQYLAMLEKKHRRAEELTKMMEEHFRSYTQEEALELLEDD